MTVEIPPITAHVWGVSPASDSVWSLVSGMRPREAGEQLFLVLQAFIDDSSDDDVFALGGFIASAEAWAKFSEEWEKAIEWGGTLGKSDTKQFKMSHMALNDERLERVPYFYRIISRHVRCAVSCVYRKQDLQAARNRIYLVGGNLNWGFMENYYLVAFKLLMDLFHNWRSKGELDDIIAPGEKVDFIFDNQSEKKLIRDGWDAYIDSRPESSRGLYGEEPRFENDERFLPIQAADFWAWWIRNWYGVSSKEAMSTEQISELDFGIEKISNPEFVRFRLWVNEDQLAENLMDVIRQTLPSEVLVVDLKHFSVSATF